MAKSKPSPEERLSLTTNPTDPKMTALQTLAAAFVLGSRLEIITDDRIEIDDEIDAAREATWSVFLEQVKSNIEEIRQAFIFAREWEYEHRQLELATMPYADYLQTMEWYQTRRWMLERAEHRCQVCNSPENLHVHHRTYDRRGNEGPTDLIVLCAECHKLFHDHGKLVK